jgi:eukaryotic-like serine/threonine-protein kinase
MRAERSSTVVPLRPERRRFGDYEVIAPLASGGMGGVFLAAHVPTGERVALKVLDPHFAGHGEVVARMLAERAVSARACHVGLLDVRAAARSENGAPYLVMEYVDGDTVAAVAEREPLALDVIVHIGAQAASALAALHATGVIHCDVKPENVMVSRDGAWRVKVIDFGVARGFDEPPADDASIAGTPAYMAPEQWRGRPVPASDVYALGCMLFELITGETPFDGSLPQLMLAHMEQRAPRPSWLRRGVPLDLELAVLRALAKDPALRPTMHELARALADVASGVSASDTLRMAV